MRSAAMRSHAPQPTSTAALRSSKRSGNGVWLWLANKSVNTGRPLGQRQLIRQDREPNSSRIVVATTGRATETRIQQSFHVPDAGPLQAAWSGPASTAGALLHVLDKFCDRLIGKATCVHGARTLLPGTASESTPRGSRGPLRIQSPACGSDFIGWPHFQTLYDQIAATQPNLFD